MHVMVRDFQRYPVLTSLSSEYDNQLDFPAITVWNMNRHRASKVPTEINLLVDRLAEVSPLYIYIVIKILRELAGAGRLGVGATSRDWFTAVDQEYMVILLTFFHVELAGAGRLGVGATSRDWFTAVDQEYMVILLTFFHVELAGAGRLGKKCGLSNFTQSYDSRYGNCFRFAGTPDQDTNVWMDVKAGPKHGLVLEMNVGADDYLAVSDTVGLLVLVHDPDEVVYPKDGGAHRGAGLLHHYRDTEDFYNLTSKFFPYPELAQTSSKGHAYLVHVTRVTEPER
ncbi:hypothetical protein RRG08_065445 [Elysia crispata]|uniref:Uncharacterized protein n=1 Tax=Elysia crispata TaxID=231223 RepID=A0AAE0YIW9_9GAST|nr:hypothetical protein RRG08_065445 [Elysia crispata]